MKQNTIKNEVSFSGIGLHSGVNVVITLKPALENTGIVFRRVDVKKNNEILATFGNVSNPTLGTEIANKGVKVQTIEHLMASLWACNIDNILIEINNQETPIMDGSAAVFIAEIQKAGIVEQSANRKYLVIKKDVELVDGNKLLRIKPYNGFKVDIEVEYKYGGIGKQIYAFDGNQESFIKDIALARTFCNFAEIENMKRIGFAKGGSEDNAAVYDDTKILNKSGLRCENEVAKHKLLDLVGDLFTSGYYIKGEVKAVWNGHALHNKFLKKIFATGLFSKENNNFAIEE